MKKLLTYLTLLVFACGLHAQMFIGDTEFEHFDYNIKVIDEFILRFNLKDLLVKPEQDSLWRKDNRILLFDRQAYLQNKEVADSFIDAIERNKVKIAFEDTAWCALAHCEVLLNGKTDSLVLKLKTEKVKDDIYKWSIADVYGKALALTPKTQSDRLRILPNQHDVNFITLQSVTTTNSQNIQLYSSDSFKADRLTAFNTLVYYGHLHIKEVKRVTYAFQQVPDYRFFVRQFVREEKNSGYLIYRVENIAVTDNNQKPQDKAGEATKQIKQFYELLSQYSHNTQNVSLARKIKSMFISADKEPYVFGVSHLTNDIERYIRRAKESRLVSIGEYLTEIEDLADENIKVGFFVTDIKVLQISRNASEFAYKVGVRSRDGKVNYNFNARIKIVDNKIVSILPY